VNRWSDWWEQAQRDVTHAQHSLDVGDFEWAAFAAQQGAEKALKAVIFGAGGEPWGHLTFALVEALPTMVATTDSVRDAAKRLDKHYIPARYPNGFASGFPGKLYTKGEAQQAIDDAQLITTFCRSHLPQER
jgi:HEPN domain-containing protein